MKRIPIEAPAKFQKDAKKSIQTGAKLIVDGIILTPPTKSRPTWRLKYTHQNTTKERSGGRTIESAYSAFLELIAIQGVLKSGVLKTPQYAQNSLFETLDQYIKQGGGKFKWKKKTRDNRRGDLLHLLEQSKKSNIKCADLNINHLRTFLNGCAHTQPRAEHIQKVLKTFMEYGLKSGYFTQEQVGFVDAIKWNPPLGSSYRVAPTRRQQSKEEYGTEERAGGEIPTHDQVVALAQGLQKRYKFGEALIHLSANLGTRANETFLLTADREVFKSGKGNFVDTVDWNALVHWQVNDDPDQDRKTTKNSKNRSVHIPSVEMIETGFNLRDWLLKRCAEALQEQDAGTNPLALIFPNKNMTYIKLASFTPTYMNPVAEELGWRMQPKVNAIGKSRSLNRFTLHSLRDRFGTTAADEWGYTERQLLEQGSWADPQTVRKYYLGTSDDTQKSVKDLHNKLTISKTGQKREEVNKGENVFELVIVKN
jgi:hypothetical protein